MLLESYHSERHPIAEGVLKKTGIMTRLIMVANPVLITLRNFILHTATSFDSLKNLILNDLAELSVNYATSPIVKVLGQKTHFKIGGFLIDFPFIDIKNQEKKELHQITQGTRHHLFLFTGFAHNLSSLFEIAVAIEQRFKGLIKPHIVLSHSEITLPAEDISLLIDEHQKMHQYFKINQPTAVLVRPDKYIGLTQLPVNTEELLGYIEKTYFHMQSNS